MPGGPGCTAPDAASSRGRRQTPHTPKSRRPPGTPISRQIRSKLLQMQFQGSLQLCCGNVRWQASRIVPDPINGSRIHCGDINPLSLAGSSPRVRGTHCIPRTTHRSLILSCLPAAPFPAIREIYGECRKLYARLRLERPELQPLPCEFPGFRTGNSQVAIREAPGFKQGPTMQRSSVLRAFVASILKPAASTSEGVPRSFSKNLQSEATGR